MLYVVGLISFIFAFGVMRNVRIQMQVTILPDLIQVSTILFAILGVWVAVLDPTTLLNKNPSNELTPRSKLALKFIPLLVITTIVFLLTVLIKFITPLLVLFITPSVQLIPLYRASYGFIITLLFVAEIWVIIGTLLPIANVLKKEREDNVKKGYRNDNHEA